MFLKVLKAIHTDLCQTDKEELLVPNPMIVPDQDNDHFIGIHSRRPARYGRVTVLETLDAESIVSMDESAIGGETPEADEERREDVRFLLDVLGDFDPGTVLGCRYSLDDDEVSWEIFEVDEATWTPLA